MTSVARTEPPGAAVTSSDQTPEEAERRTSFLELFFDLVFVFAITQVTAMIVDDPSAAGFARATLVLALVWWAWSSYTWMTNAIDIGSRLVRIAFVLAMGLTFVLALAVPHAYTDEGAWFAVPYVLVRVLNVCLYAFGLRHDRAHLAAFARLAPWFLASTLPALAGGLVDGDARWILWLVSISVDVIGTLTVSQAGFRVSPSHFAERYALFVIIALGESVVAIGIGAAEHERDVLFAVSVAVAFVGVAALWFGYFDFTQTAAERSLHARPPDRRGPLARDVFTLFHFPLVLGIILYAVAAKKALAHPDEPLSAGGRWALALGLTSFLLGFVLSRFRVVRRIAWERLGGGAAVIGLTLALRDADALVLLAAAIAAYGAALVIESVRLRDVRAWARAG